MPKSSSDGKWATADDEQPASVILDYFGRYWIYGFALIPLLRVLTLTSWNGEFTTWQMSWRLFWLPSLYLEFGVIGVALMHRMKPSAMLRALPVWIVILLAIWMTAMIVATSLSQYREAATTSLVIWTVHLLFAGGAFHLLKYYRSSLNDLAPSLVLTFLVSAASAGVVITGFVLAKGIESDFDWSGDLPGYGHIRHTGYIFAPAVAAGFASMAIWPAYRPKVIWMASTICICAMLWLGSRGPVFALLAAIIPSALLFPHFRSVRWIRTTLSASVVGALFSLIIPMPNVGWFGAVKRIWVGGADMSELSSNRVDIWRETISLILNRPYAGYGGLQFQHIVESSQGLLKHPHNSVLQFILDWGILGGIAMVLLFSAILLGLVISRARQCDLSPLAFMVGCTMLVFSLIDGILFYSFTIATSLLFLLMPYAAVQKQPSV